MLALACRGGGGRVLRMISGLGVARRFWVILLLVLPFLAGSLKAEEMRAAWVASVYNINFPSRSGLSASAMKGEIANLVKTAKSAGLNALFVQVRPEGDALYESRIEPWSRFLTGKQGRSPGFDPLEEFIRVGKKYGVEIHAWLNPYRAASSSKASRVGNHLSNRYANGTRRTGSLLWMDPGYPKVQDHVVAVVKDIVNRYDVAGVHLDDYFYPYPEHLPRGGFPDSSTYAAYRKSGGKLGKDDWRRQNVNQLVERLHKVVKSRGKVFGISPFGIYTKGQPPTVKAGLDQLNQLYADPVRWMREGWVDYLAPQLYWHEGGPQSFSELLKWWRSPQVNPRRIPIYPGIAVDRMRSHGWSSGEIAKQLSLEEKIGPGAGAGFVLWSIGPVMSDTKGVRKVVASAR